MSTYGEFCELLLGLLVLLPPEGAPLGEKLTLGVGFGLGVVLPARSSGAIAHGKWQDQACVDSITQKYARSTIITVHNKTDMEWLRGSTEERVKGELY